ncbi:COG3014 family protein [Rariglobus hedericola]|uniref:Lipoprotein n=1 Tax=Rariglobus hedericola TaxID=2597822 RepID=A0A556QIV8_9BACT|nr:hypothetical protein [Rariglobus hedericola]TSJ76584.1 hypothetical protein FPL22_10665 [Rariglobus hedericola]
MKSTARARQIAQFTGAAALLLLASGCQTYQQQSADLASSFRNASIASAVASADKEAASKAGGKDELLWRLEQGATLRMAVLADETQLPHPPVAAPKDPAEPVPVAPTHTEIAAGYAKRSNTAFDQAEERVNYWEEQAKLKVGSEAFSIVTNQANIPYRGRAYDKVLMNAYKALNYLQMGQRDAARVELNRSLQRQRDAVDINQKRIAEAQAEADKAREGKVEDEKGQTASYDVDKAQADPKTGPALNQALAESTAPIKAYGDYVNPFAVFLDGLFFSIAGENGADWERGRKSFERLASLVPENPYVIADRDLGAAAAEGKAPENLTYVIFETGTGPERDQIRIDIPTFIVTSRLAYVGAAFPKLKFNGDYASSLTVTAGGQSAATATIASMDSVVANDFKNEWPTILTKTLVSTATKAIIQATVQKQLSDQSAMAGLIGSVTMTVLNASTNIADTRTWITLPKEFQYARIATPADRQLTLTTGTQTKTITLDPGVVNVVYVKSVSSTAPLLVSQILLK